MAEKTVRLVYPPSLMNVPVIHKLIRQFDVTVNILGAQIDIEHGWLEMQMSGSDSTIKQAIDWLKGLKIEIQEIPPRYEG
jgi:ABC-type methionine transport system ATPase subunit